MLPRINLTKLLVGDNLLTKYLDELVTFCL